MSTDTTKEMQAGSVPAGTVAAARTALLDYLRSQDLTFGRGPKGEILVPFDLPGRRLLVVAQFSEQPQPGMWLQMVSADRIAREHWAATLVAVNQWNTLVRSPRAVLRVGDWDTDADAAMTLDEWLPFGRSRLDVTQIQLVTATMLAASSYFGTVSPVKPATDPTADPSG
jgi:hypothetical protein